MSKDILSETFQKHLKLLHKHLNINEANFIPGNYQPPRDPDDDYSELRTDMDGWKINPNRPKGRYISPEEIARNEFSKTVAGYARDYLDRKENGLVRYLNQIKYHDKNNWKTTDIFEPHHHTDRYANFDNDAFKRWAERDKEESDRSYKNRKEKELGNELENVSDDLKIPMAGLIKTFGTFGWQKYKRKNIKEKISELTSQAANNEEKVKKEIGDKDYDKLIKYLRDAEFAFLKDEYNEKKYTDIMNRTIEKAEKMLGRGFFEQ